MVDLGPLDMRRPPHLPPMAPPRPGDVRRPQEPPPIAAGAIAGQNIRRGAGNAGGVGANDHMWEVFGGRAQSNSPRPGRRRSVSVEADGVPRSAPDNRGRPGALGAPVNQLPPPQPAPFDARGGQGGSPGAYARRNVWEDQGIAFPEKAALAEGLGLDLKHRLVGLEQGHLKHRLVGLEAGVADAQGFVERRLESVQADVRQDISQRFTTFENADKRFKDWVQREHESLNGELQQVKVAAMDGAQQNQRQATAVANHCQKLDLRLSEMEAAIAQTDGKANGLAHALQAAGAAQGAEAAAANGVVQVSLDALRAELEREAAARQMLAAEATEKIKELHGLIASVNERQEQEALGRQHQIAEQSAHRQAGFAALEPVVGALRSEVDVLREQLRHADGDTSRRCQEIEAALAQRMAGVQESALSAARELWEEHNGVVAECKASMSSLQQILETKDKIAAQLQTLMQQQHQDDKEGLLVRLLQGDDVLRSRLTELEAAVANEQTARLEAQQTAGAHAGRIGVALEKAQESWLKDSERLASELREVRRQADRVIEGEARGWERRLAEAVDLTQRRLDALESKASSAKAGNNAAEEKVATLARNQEAGLSEIEARLRRHVDDVQTMQAGKIAQSEFDLRAALRREVAESAERARVELARVEEAATVERSVLRAVAEDAARDVEARFSKLREDFERRLAAADDASLRRSAQASEAYSQLRADLTEYHGEARAYADRVGQDARAVAEAAHHGLSEDVARQATRTDRSIADLLRQLESQEERLYAAVTSAEKKAAVQIADAVKLARSEMLQEAERLIEQERSARMQAEAERLASLQKRLAAHEELTSRRLDELRARQDDAHATHRQQIEAAMAQDRTEIVSQLEEIARDQRDAAANAQAELARLDASCEKLMADCDQALKDVTEATEKAVKRLEERLEMELAAFQAKLTVGLTTASAELRMGLAGADERLAAAVTEAAEARAALRSDLEGSLNHLETAIGAVGTEAAVARAELRTSLQEATAELGRKLDEHAVSSEERATGLDARADGLQLALDSLGTRLEEQGAQLATAVAAVREDAEAGIREGREAAQAEHAAMGEKLLQVRDDMRGLEDTVLARLQDAESGLAERLEVWAAEQHEARVSQEQSIATNRRALENLDARCEVERNAATAALEKAREEIAADALAARCASEEVLAGLEAKLEGSAEEAAGERQMLRESVEDLGAGLQSQVSLLKTVTEQLHREEGRASEAEAALKKSLEEGQAQTNSAAEEMRNRLEALLSEQEKALQAEEARAIKAEADLAAQAEALTKGTEDRFADLDKQLATEKKQSEDRFADLDTRLAAEKKQSEEGRAELKADFTKRLEEMHKATEESLSLGLGGELKRATGAEGELQKQLDNAEEKLQQLAEKQNKQAEDSASDLQAQLDAIRKERESALEAMRGEREVALRAEKERATADAADLSAKVEASEKAQGDALEALRQKLEAKDTEQQEAQKRLEEAMQKSQEEAAVERATEKASASEGFQRQMEELRGEHAKSRAELEDNLKSTQEAQAKTSAQQAEIWQAEAEELRTRLGEAEKLSAEQAQQLKDEHDLQERLGTDLTELAKRMQELDKSGESRTDDMQAKNLAEFDALREQIQGLKDAHEKSLSEQAEARVTESAAADKSDELVSQLRSDFDALKQVTAEFQDSQAKTNGSQSKINEAQEKSDKEKAAAIEDLKGRLATLQDASDSHADELKGQLAKVSEEQGRLASEHVEAKASAEKSVEEQLARISEEQASMKEQFSKVSEEQGRLASELTEVKAADASTKDQLSKVSEEQGRLASKQDANDTRADDIRGQLDKVTEEQGRLASEQVAAKASETSLKEQLAKLSEEQARLASQLAEAKASEASVQEQLSKVSEEQGRLASEQAKASEEQGRLASQQAEVKAAEASMKEQLSKVAEEQGRLASELPDAKAAEASAKEAASAQEAMEQLRSDFDAFKKFNEEFQEGQVKTNDDQSKVNKEQGQTADGLGEQLGDLVLKVADLMGKVEGMAPAEEVSRLESKFDGGFDALVVQLEADRWLRLQTDSVADGISKDFLNLLDQTCEKLEMRVRKCEEAVRK